MGMNLIKAHVFNALFLVNLKQTFYSAYIGHKLNIFIFAMVIKTKY